MLPDIDRLGPELVLMVSAGLIILADLALREGMPTTRRGAILACGGLAGIVGAVEREAGVEPAPTVVDEMLAGAGR